MSVSAKQLAANRRNAQKSTGPRTPEGKTVAGRNALTHGLTAGDVVIDSPRLRENRADYTRLVESLFAELKPRGLFQEQLVLKIANCLWRQRRAINAERALISRNLDTVASCYRHLFGPGPDDGDPSGDTPTDSETARRRADLVALETVPKDNEDATVVIYEMRLDRQLTRAYQLLRQLQQAASSESPPDRRCQNEKMKNEPILPPPPGPGPAPRAPVGPVPSPEPAPNDKPDPAPRGQPPAESPPTTKKCNAVVLLNLPGQSPRMPP